MSDVKPSAAAPDRLPRIVGFLCDWAVSSDGLVGEDGTMRDLPSVTLIKVPCSGFVRPAWLEFALRNGADGAFVCGCPLGDCFNRLGNNLIADRVVQMRRRLERQKVQPDRITTIFHGLHDQTEFVAAVREFSDHVANLPAPAPTPARKPPGSPAVPAGTGGVAKPPSGDRPGGPASPAAPDVSPGEARPSTPTGQGES